MPRLPTFPELRALAHVARSFADRLTLIAKTRCVGMGHTGKPQLACLDVAGKLETDAFCWACRAAWFSNECARELEQSRDALAR